MNVEEGRSRTEDRVGFLRKRLTRSKQNEGHGSKRWNSAKQISYPLQKSYLFKTRRQAFFKTCVYIHVTVNFMCQLDWAKEYLDSL